MVVLFDAFCAFIQSIQTGIAESVMYGNRGYIPLRKMKFVSIPNRPDRLWSPPSLLLMGTGSFVLGGVKLS